MTGALLNEEYFRGDGRNDLTKGNRLKLIGIYILGFLIAIALMSNIADTLLRALQRTLAH